MAKFVIALAKRAYVSFTNAGSDVIAEYLEFSRTLFHTSKVHEVKVILANGAVLPRVFAFGTARSTLSADSVLHERNPNFCGAFRALCEAHLFVFQHFQPRTTLEANLSIVVRAREA